MYITIKSERPDFQNAMLEYLKYSMLEKPKKPIKNKAFLPLLVFVLPFTAYAISFSILTEIFKVSDKKEVLTSRSENLQNLKVFEPSKILSDSENIDTNSLSIVGENDTSFETGNDFTDDLTANISENHSENAIYTVQKGDSIYSIASYFGVSVETIMSFNHLSSKAVHNGDVLEVPSVSGVPYRIGKGDTLAKISKKYNIDTEDIALYNGLQEDEMLVVGDEIFIPNAKETIIVPKITTVTKIAKNTIKDTNINTSSTFVKDISSAQSTVKWARGDTAHLNTPAAIAKNSSLPKYEGYFLFPAPGATRTQKMHGNNGCDLANKIGSPVLASATGVVTVAKSGGYNFGYGNYIKIKHPNGTETIYGHLSRVDVSVGQSVSRGEQIGAVGSTGNSTGPHLHFEIHGAYNPFAW